MFLGKSRNGISKGLPSSAISWWPKPPLWKIRYTPYKLAPKPISVKGSNRGSFLPRRLIRSPRPWRPIVLVWFVPRFSVLPRLEWIERNSATYIYYIVTRKRDIRSSLKSLLAIQCG